MTVDSNALKKYFNSLKSYSFIENLQLAALVSFAATIALDPWLNSALLIVTLFTLLPTFSVAGFKKYSIPIVIFTSGFIFSLAGLIYTCNLNEGLHNIERQLSLFLFPVLFFSSFRFTETKIRLIAAIFFLSILGVSLYLVRESASLFMVKDATLKEWLVKENLNHAFSKPIEMHATYLSLYLGMAIFMGFSWFVAMKEWWLKVFLLLSILVLAFTLTLLLSRVVIWSVLILLLFIYPFSVSGVRNKFLLLLAGGTVILIFIGVKRESHFVTERFTAKTNEDIQMSQFLAADSTYNPELGGSSRADRWYCAIELIREKPLLGYGTGCEKDALMEKYRKYNMQNAILNRYDSHNQYLAFTIKNGVLGLILFLLPIIYGIYLSIRKRSFLYLSFILLFAFTCLTENVLESNKGIFFFAIFNTLLCYECLFKLREEKAE
jgi:O-antigen ligase